MRKDGGVHGPLGSSISESLSTREAERTKRLPTTWYIECSYNLLNNPSLRNEKLSPNTA